MRQFFRKGRRLMMAALFLVLFSIPVQAAPPETAARAAVVYDVGTGTVLYEKAGGERLPMASTTKIMTAYLVLESAALCDRVVTVSETAVSVEGSSAGLRAGDRIRLSDLAACMLLASGNDAAVAGAEAVGGSEEVFVRRMNQTAAQWGLTDTHFDTASGLDGDTHYTTACELAKITARALENERFAELCACKNAAVSVLEADGTARTISLTNHNKLLWQLENCMGVKTGYTEKSGRCLVSCIRQEGATLVVVTLRDPNDWQDHAALQEYGLSCMDRIAVSEEDVSYTVPLKDGGEMLCLPQEETITFCLPVQKKELVRSLEWEELSAVPEKGEAVGSILYTWQGKEIGRIPITVVSVRQPPVPEEDPWWVLWWEGLLSFLHL